jgi:hypothetical protein
MCWYLYRRLKPTTGTDPAHSPSHRIASHRPYIFVLLQEYHLHHTAPGHFYPVTPIRSINNTTHPITMSATGANGANGSVQATPLMKSYEADRDAKSTET